MDSDPAITVLRKHTNGWMTILALALLAVGLLACLYVLVGVPAEAQTVSDAPTASSPAPVSAPPLRRPSYLTRPRLKLRRSDRHL